MIFDIIDEEKVNCLLKNNLEHGHEENIIIKI
jgi:hypothetical protein